MWWRSTDQGEAVGSELVPWGSWILLWGVELLSGFHMNSGPCDAIFTDVPIVILGWNHVGLEKISDVLVAFLILYCYFLSLSLVGLVEVNVEGGASPSDVVQGLLCSGQGCCFSLLCLLEVWS